MDNPETQATLGTRHRTKTNKTTNTIKNTKKMRNTDTPPQKKIKIKTNKKQNKKQTKSNKNWG